MYSLSCRFPNSENSSRSSPLKPQGKAQKITLGLEAALLVLSAAVLGTLILTNGFGIKALSQIGALGKTAGILSISVPVGFLLADVLLGSCIKAVKQRSALKQAKLLENQEVEKPNTEKLNTETEEERKNDANITENQVPISVEKKEQKEQENPPADSSAPVSKNEAEIVKEPDTKSLIEQKEQEKQTLMEKYKKLLGKMDRITSQKNDTNELIGMFKQRITDLTDWLADADQMANKNVYDSDENRRLESVKRYKLEFEKDTNFKIQNIRKNISELEHEIEKADEKYNNLYIKSTRVADQLETLGREIQGLKELPAE